MDKGTAEIITGLSSRHIPMASREFLSCQLGKNEHATVQTSAYRTLHVPVFRLIAFGSNWENAVSMWEKLEAQRKEKTD